MLKKKETENEARILEYRDAIEKKHNSVVVFLLDILLFAILLGALYLGFTNFGETKSEYEKNELLRFAGLGALGVGFVLSYAFSFIFHDKRNSQNLRDRAWMFLLTALLYYGYILTYDLWIAAEGKPSDPLVRLLPTFLLIAPPFAIAFLAGRGHITLMGALSHFTLITAYLYATYIINYISALTSFHNYLLLVNGVESASNVILMVHDWVYVASLLGMGHFLFMRKKYRGWVNIVYVLSGLVSLGHAGLFIYRDVLTVLDADLNFEVILDDTLFIAVAAVFSLVFGFVEFFSRDHEKERAGLWFVSIIFFILAGIFGAGGYFGLPIVFDRLGLTGNMYTILGYAIMTYLFLFAFFFLLSGINQILRAVDEKWSLDKKANIPAENRAAFFSGSMRPNIDFVNWTKGEPAKLAIDNKHLFAIESPEDFSSDAKKQTFLRYVLALVDVNRKEYRLVYQGKVYYSSPSRIDPRTGRPVVSLESDTRLDRQAAIKATKAANKAAALAEKAAKKEAKKAKKAKKEEAAVEDGPTIVDDTEEKAVEEAPFTTETSAPVEETKPADVVEPEVVTPGPKYDEAGNIIG